MTANENESFVVTEVRGQVGCITLNRPKALNALSLAMIRSLTRCLLDWRDDDSVKAVAIRGNSKGGNFGAFCAGGDIRFFHQAALAGNPELEDFFSEEYALNHLIHSYAKPYIALMDGIVMGGGMGLCQGGAPADPEGNVEGVGRVNPSTRGQGARLRIVTHNTRMAMPETNIGLFPDVGGGCFLSRCPGRSGEWLALTGETLVAGQAVALGLADACFDAAALPLAWDALAATDFSQAGAIEAWLANYSIAAPAHTVLPTASIDRYFGLATVGDIVQALEDSTDPWARDTAATLRRRSPLMLHVVLEQIRRARSMTLADDLRMERDMVRHCFHTLHLERCGASSETVEGIRALAVDKDQQPRWQPARVEDVTPAMVAPFFISPWPAPAHPLRDLV